MCLFVLMFLVLFQPQPACTCFRTSLVLVIVMFILAFRTYAPSYVFSSLLQSCLLLLLCIIIDLRGTCIEAYIWLSIYAKEATAGCWLLFSIDPQLRYDVTLS